MIMRKGQMKTEFCKYNHIFNPQAKSLGLVNVVAEKREMEHSSLAIYTKFNKVTIYQMCAYTLLRKQQADAKYPRAINSKEL